MYLKTYLGVFVCLAIALASSEEIDTKLVMLQVIFRHGVRSVLQNYPSDPTPITYWDKYGGTGQLTKVGMRQLYDYGKKIKETYPELLDGKYDRREVYAKSTDYDRTLMSTNCFLSGVFKPSEEQAWSPDVNLSSWIPIPIHTTSLESDQVLHANAPCPRYDQLRKIMRSSKEFLDRTNENAEFLKNMSRLSGLTDLNYYTMWQIADNALVDEAHEIPVQPWITENYEKIMLANDYTFYIDFVTVEMGKLIAGGLLNSVVQNINKKVAGSRQKLAVFGVHDNYIAGMQKILNTSTEFVQPHFASSFIFELRNDSAGNYYVKVFYKNEKFPAPIDIKPVTVYGCESLCPLPKFLELTKLNLVTNFDSICQEVTTPAPTIRTTTKTTTKTTTRRTTPRRTTPKPTQKPTKKF